MLLAQYDGTQQRPDDCAASLQLPPQLERGDSHTAHTIRAAPASAAAVRVLAELCCAVLLRAFGVLYLAAAVLAYLYVMPHFEPGRGVHHAATSLSAVGPQLQPLVDVFPGPAWRTEQTLASKLLLSDKRMRVESHTVKGEDGKIYDDWIWVSCCSKTSSRSRML